MAPPDRGGYSAVMKDDPDRWFDACVERLTDPQNLRVWSIIVSVFGDLAQGSGDRLSGGALTRIDLEVRETRPRAPHPNKHGRRYDRKY